MKISYLLSVTVTVTVKIKEYKFNLEDKVLVFLKPIFQFSNFLIFFHVNDHALPGTTKHKNLVF